MGSCSKIDLAYIAGFLDGDGSLMIQIKKRNDSKKYRFMLTICMYQNTRHEKPLFWIKNKLGIGYISKRNDNITELRINGYNQVKKILTLLIPFIKFKKIQAKTLIESAKLLEKKELKKADYLKLVNYITLVQSTNYTARKKRTKQELFQILELTP